jgi:hypothetical protein
MTSIKTLNLRTSGSENKKSFAHTGAKDFLRGTTLLVVDQKPGDRPANDNNRSGAQ